MKLTISKEKIVNALQKCQAIVEKKKPIQILSNLLLDLNGNTLSVTATDLEVGFRTFIDVVGEENGRITVSAKNFFEIVKSLGTKEFVLQKKDNNWIEILSGKTKFNIVGLAAEDFPPFPSFENKTFYKVNSKVIKEMIEKTSFAMSQDEARYHLNGVFLEKNENNVFRMVATNGRILSYVENKISEEEIESIKKGIIIPKKGVSELNKIAEETETLDISIENNNLLIKKDNTNLTIRLVDGDYPDYRQVIPKTFNKTLKMDGSLFNEALHRASLMQEDKSKAVKLILSKEVCELYANNPELGDLRDSFEAEYEGEDLTIGFDPKYLKETIKALKENKIIINFNDPLKPGIVKTATSENAICIVMPMRI